MQIVKKAEPFQHCLPVFNANNENPPSPLLCLKGGNTSLWKREARKDFKEKAFIKIDSVR